MAAKVDANLAVYHLAMTVYQLDCAYPDIGWGMSYSNAVSEAAKRLQLSDSDYDHDHVVDLMRANNKY